MAMLVYRRVDTCLNHSWNLELCFLKNLPPTKKLKQFFFVFFFWGVLCGGSCPAGKLVIFQQKSFVICKKAEIFCSTSISSQRTLADGLF